GVDADDEVLVGVQRQAGTYHVLPPAGRGVVSRRRSMGGRRKAREKQDRVVACPLEPAPGFISYGGRFEKAATMHREPAGDLHPFTGIVHSANSSSLSGLGDRSAVDQS